MRHAYRASFSAAINAAFKAILRMFPPVIFNRASFFSSRFSVGVSPGNTRCHISSLCAALGNGTEQQSVFVEEKLYPSHFSYLLLVLPTHDRPPFAGEDNSLQCWNNDDGCPTSLRFPNNASASSNKRIAPPSSAASKIRFRFFSVSPIYLLQPG